MILLCGDFNINRDPLNKHTVEFLAKKGDDWAEVIPSIDREYDDVF